MIAFVDTDVVISSFISKTGAAYFLLNKPTVAKLVISDQSQSEISRVAKELDIKTLDIKVNLIKVTVNLTKYSKFVVDSNDSHIIGAAHQAKAKFLISYNLKHFKKDSIKEELDIIVITPGQFLQYLRSLL